MREIGQRYGEAHLALVLRLIVETGNADELHASTIKAISAVVLSGRVVIGAGLFDALDAIDLPRLRALPGSTVDTMAAALLALLTGQEIRRAA